MQAYAYYLDPRLVQQDYESRLRRAAAEHRATAVERLGQRQQPKPASRHGLAKALHSLLTGVTGSWPIQARRSRQAPAAGLVEA